MQGLNIYVVAARIFLIKRWPHYMRKMFVVQGLNMCDILIIAARIKR